MASKLEIHMHKSIHFWKWFSDNRLIFQELLISEKSADLSNLVALEVERLDPNLAWEIGPGLKKPFSFVLSPNCVRDNLSVTKLIIAKAPSFSDWEFYPARPPKIWNLKFEMANSYGEHVQIDANGWMYELTGFENNSIFDIDIFCIDLPNLDDSAKSIASQIVIQGIVGEEVFLSRFDMIKLYGIRVCEDPDNLSKITNLLDHINFIDTSAN